MKSLFISAIFALATPILCHSTNTIKIVQPQTPILIERIDNTLMLIRIDNDKIETLNAIKIDFTGETDIKKIKEVKLFYSGGAVIGVNESSMLPVSYISSHEPGATLAANKSYSKLIASIKPKSNNISLKGDVNMIKGVNFFWVSIEMEKNSNLSNKLTATIKEIEINGKPAHINSQTEKLTRRMGIGVRHAGDDGSKAYRIPALVTANDGTLIAGYDIRYNSSVDLQEDVDVGINRSHDKGRTWEKMQIIMDAGEYGGLPEAQNGIGDPAILVDKKNGTIWAIAAWIHGKGNGRAWFNSDKGMSIDSTAQLMLTKSIDNGKTWSNMINITHQVKDPSWYFLLQGPGMGITMHDGTLVFPIQFIDSTKVPNAGIMYSKDQGVTWKIENLAHTNTTESQVAEIENGVLMLNMRDNRGGSRAIYTTKDLGKTWQPHSSNKSALQEPVCMASLINIKAEDNNFTKQDILLFSNPDHTKDRKNITIKASLDGGKTWKKANSLLLDSEYGWGYSCLTLVDKDHIGILYESSVAHMTYQLIPLRDIIKEL